MPGSRKLPGVRFADPMIENQVMVTASGVARGAVVRGLRPADLKHRAIIANAITAGSLDDFHGNDAIVIGGRLADRLGLDVGDRLTLISPAGTVTAFGTVPRVRAYKIVALFDVGMYEYDSSFVFMPLDAAQTYFNLPNAVTTLEVFIDDPDRAGEISKALWREIDDPLRVADWQQLNAGFFNAIQVERNVMFLILTLIIVVAAFNIISSLIMLVKEKGRAIAILRTMGATRGAITRIFFITGVQRRRRRHALGVRSRPRLRPQYRNHPPVDPGLYRHRPVRVRDLLFVEAAGEGGRDGGRRRHHHGPGAVVPRHPLSGMAGGADRAGGSAPV